MRRCARCTVRADLDATAPAVMALTDQAEVPSVATERRGAAVTVGKSLVTGTVNAIAVEVIPVSGGDAATGMPGAATLVAAMNVVRLQEKAGDLSVRKSAQRPVRAGRDLIVPKGTTTTSREMTEVVAVRSSAGLSDVRDETMAEATNAVGIEVSEASTATIEVTTDVMRDDRGRTRVAVNVKAAPMLEAIALVSETVDVVETTAGEVTIAATGVSADLEVSVRRGAADRLREGDPDVVIVVTTETLDLVTAVVTNPRETRIEEGVMIAGVATVSAADVRHGAAVKAEMIAPGDRGRDAMVSVRDRGAASRGVIKVSDRAVTAASDGARAGSRPGVIVVNEASEVRAIRGSAIVARAGIPGSATAANGARVMARRGVARVIEVMSRGVTAITAASVALAKEAIVDAARARRIANAAAASGRRDLREGGSGCQRSDLGVRATTTTSRGRRRSRNRLVGESSDRRCVTQRAAVDLPRSREAGLR